jgi:RHS repeat-associated protein
MYDAVGTKLRKKVTDGTSVLIQDYLGGIELKNNRLESIYNEEGRAFNTTNATQAYPYTWRREYNLKDHLGNTRVVFTDKNNDGKINDQTEILQETHYYPFGMSFGGAWYNDAAASKYKYLYNGKELNEEFGLNLSDYGARWYDAAVGRFWNSDPLADIFHYQSTYAYAANNPVGNIDFMGMGPVGADGMTNDQWMKASNPANNSSQAAGPLVNRDNQSKTNKIAMPYGYKVYQNDEEVKNVVEGYNWVDGGCDCGCEGKPPCFDWTGGRGSAIFSFPNSINRMVYAGNTWLLKYQYAADRFVQAGADARLSYKTISRNFTLGPTRNVLNIIDPLKAKPLPVSYWKTNKWVNVAGFGGTILSGFGLYVSASNIINSENKIQQTAIEASGWAGAYAGAQLSAPLAAYIAPFTGPFAPVTAVLIVGGGSVIGSFGGSYLGHHIFN